MTAGPAISLPLATGAASLRCRKTARSRIVAAMILALAALIVLGGCRSPGGAKPGRTRLSSKLIEVPVLTVGNLVVIETQWDRGGPWRFLVDTGSSATLVSPEFAERYRTTEAAWHAPTVRVRDASGRATTLEAVTIRRIEVGDARFERVQSLVYDCSEISAHLGMKIDGVLGFPLFRETILTLDYPKSRLILTGASSDAPLLPGSTILFNAGARVPLIPVQIAGRTLLALIDSGNDGPLNLNPTGLQLEFASGPRPGSTIGTLTGDRQQDIGRLTETLQIGAYQLPRPIVDLTDDLSSLGGEILHHFSVTFDQVRGTATFYRETVTPIASPPRRSPGLSFSKAGAYWRVAGIVPGSPAAETSLRVGDLVVRVNGESVERWSLHRFRQLVDTANEIEYTLLSGREERTVTIAPFVLVP